MKATKSPALGLEGKVTVTAPLVVLTKYPSPLTAVKSPVLTEDCQAMSDVIKVLMSVIDKTPEAFVVIILFAEPLVLGNVNS